MLDIAGITGSKLKWVCERQVRRKEQVSWERLEGGLRGSRGVGSALLIDALRGLQSLIALEKD